MVTASPEVLMSSRTGGELWPLDVKPSPFCLALASRCQRAAHLVGGAVGVSLVPGSSEALLSHDHL